MNKLLNFKCFFLLIIILFLNNCSTYVEDIASEEFRPIQQEISFAENNKKKTGAIYKDGQGGLFSSDRRARKVGDILTVDFNEAFVATKSQTTNSSKQDSYDLTLPNVLPNAITGGLGNGEAKNSLATSTTQSFKGSGDAGQSNSLTGKISVTVVRVFDNGNLEILGQKELTLNNGQEYIRVRGIVRPEDISATNVVQSNRLADAQIRYTGAGAVSDSSKPGWLSRTLRTISPF